MALQLGCNKINNLNHLDNIEKSKKKINKVLITFETIMENGAFAPKEQMLHFP